MVGKKVVSGLVSCRGADLTTNVYVGQYDVGAEKEEVRESIVHQGVMVVELEELKLSHRRFKSFRLCIKKADMPKILDPEFWPSGVVVGRFWRGKASPSLKEPSTQKHSILQTAVQ